MSINTSTALIYGLVSITIICLLSLIGVLFLPLLRGPSKRRWLQVFVALAVATMAGDAILHIIPEVLGVHNHDHGTTTNHDHHDEHLLPTDHVHQHQSEINDHHHEHSNHVESNNNDDKPDHDDGQEELEEDNSENQTTNTTRLSFGDFNIGGSVVLEKQIFYDDISDNNGQIFNDNAAEVKSDEQDDDRDQLPLEVEINTKHKRELSIIKSTTRTKYLTKRSVQINRSLSNKVNATDDDHDNNHHHHHHHDESSAEKSHLLKMTAIMTVLYGCYVFEFVVHWGLRKKNKRSNRISHQSANTITTTSSSSSNGISSPIALVLWDNQTKPIDMYPNKSNRPSSNDTASSSIVDTFIGNDVEICCGLKTVIVMILIGDAVHNFVDGLAIGASFAANYSLGLSTSIAVVFHELPQEIGDFALLIDSGLSVGKSLLMNLLSSISAYIGLIVGLYAGQNPDAKQWLLAITAGMFLYISLFDMLNHLKEEIDENDPWYLTLSLQNVGFLIGFVAIFLVGWFEP